MLKKIEVVLNCLTDAETSQRGYIITGNESYLNPYYAAVANIDREFNELRQLGKNNSEHIQRLNALEPLIAEKLNGIKERIVIRKNKGFEAAAREVQTGKGMIAMDKIRNIIDQMEGEERSKLRQNIAETEKSGRNAFLIIIFGSSLSFAIVIIANIFTYRELKKRRQAEEELWEKEKALRVLLNAPTDAIILIDRGSTILNVNEETARRFHKRVDEIVGTYVWDLLPPDVAIRRKAYADQVFQTGESVRGEDERQGNWYDSIYYPIIDDSGEVERIVILARNITERKLMEDTIRESEARYRELFETSLDGIAVTDLQGRYLDCNRANLKLLGYDSVDELRLKSYEEITPPEYHELEKRLIKEQTLVKGYCDEYEKEYIHKTGKRIPVSLRAWLRCDRYNNPTWMWAIVRDITERKQAEEALLKAHAELEQRVEERTAELQESEAKFRTLAETSLAGIFIYQGDKFLYVNSMIEAITGYSRDELLQMKFWDFTHPDFKELIRERGYARQRGEPVPAQYEFKIINKNGNERWISVYGTAFRFADKMTALGTAFDITEKKQAEEKILMYQNQLRSLAAELTLAEERERRKISITLHDQVIQMLALCKIKIEEFKEIHPDGAMKQIDEISGFLDQVIHYSRSLVSELSPQILYTLGVEAAVEWLGEQILEKNGIKFQFQDDGQPKPLKDDIRIILFLSVRELMINVVKHAKALEAKVNIQKIDSSIQIVVEDNGAGFDTSQTITPEGHGGFGLFNIREQLYNIGGQLRVESENGHGTCMTLLAPIS